MQGRLFHVNRLPGVNGFPPRRNKTDVRLQIWLNMKAAN